MSKIIPLTNCPTCHVPPSTIHLDNCPTERCSECGEQYITCNCITRSDHDKQFARWTGISPCEAEAKYLNTNVEELHKLGMTKIFDVKPKDNRNFIILIFNQKIEKFQINSIEDIQDTILNLENKMVKLLTITK